MTVPPSRVHVHQRDIDQLWARVVPTVRIGNYFRQPDRWYILRDQSGDYPILRFFIACYKLHGFGKRERARVALREALRASRRASCRSPTLTRGSPVPFIIEICRTTYYVTFQCDLALVFIGIMSSFYVTTSSVASLVIVSLWSDFKQFYFIVK